MTNQEQESLGSLIESFRERARKLRRNAFINLFIIIAVLILGVGIFVLAGTLASKESNQVIAKEKRARLDYLRERGIDFKQEIDRTQEEKKATDSALVKEYTGEGGTKVAGEGPLFRFLKQKSEELNYRSRSLLDELHKVQQQQDDLQNEIAKAEADSGRLVLDQNQIWVLVSAIATRVGAIVLLLFLVKILVPLYRYNIKLASYYDARADVLELIGPGLREDKAYDTLAKLTSALTPEGIDFGSPPPSPTDQAIELAKHILEFQKIK